MEAREGSWRISIRMRRPDPRALAADWSAPLLLALLTVLGALQLLDAHDVVYYPMIHGATSTMRFDLGFSLVLPLLFLLLIWLSWVIWKRRFWALSFPVMAIVLYPFMNLDAVVSMGSLLAGASGLWSHRKIGRYFAGVFTLLCSVEAIALLHWAIFLPLGLSSPFVWYVNLEMGLFYLAANLAPYLAIPLMYLWAIKLLFRWRWGNKEKQEGFEHQKRKLSSRKTILLLIFFMSLGVIAALYPYLPSVNPRNRNVGVDFTYYVDSAKLVEKDLSQVFNVWGSSRPFIHLVIYGIQIMFRLDVSTAVRYLPLFLNPLLAISTFFLAREIFLDEWIASWASLFTICGIQISVGMFSYFLTNMLALSLVFLSLGFLFRAIRCGCYFNLMFASLIGSLLVFTHPWTFDQHFVTMVLTACFILYDDLKKKEGFSSFMIILCYLFTLGLSDLVKIKVFQGFGGVAASSVAIGSIVHVSKFWHNTIFFFRRIYCGLESNVILLILSIVGILILKQVSASKAYLIVFLIVTSLPFFLCDAKIKSRLIYNIPLGLYTAYGFTWLNKRKDIDDFKLQLNCFILLSMITYLLRSLANII